MPTAADITLYPIRFKNELSIKLNSKIAARYLTGLFKEKIKKIDETINKLVMRYLKLQ